MGMKKSKKNVWILSLAVMAILAAFFPAWADTADGSGSLESPRGSAFGVPKIYDINGYQLYSLNWKELMEIDFSSVENVSVIGVTVTKPDGSPDYVLPQIDAKTGKDGYVVTTKPAGTDLVVFFRPLLRGTHVVAVYYNDAKGQTIKQTFSFRSDGSDGGGGGCSTGVGAAALFAAAGLAAAGKSGRSRSGKDKADPGRK